MDFDVWSNADGKLTATVVNMQFVDDSDAPYGYSKHEVRLTAKNARFAVAKYREIMKSGEIC